MLKRMISDWMSRLRSHFTWERLHASAVRLKQGLRIIWRIFNEKGVLSHASVCSYSTILSLVPILAFSLVILNMFTSTTITTTEGELMSNEEFSNKAFDIFFNYFVPGVNVEDSLQMAETKQELISYIRKAASLRFVILIFLIVTCVGLFNSIENAYNEIWSVRNRRTFFAQFIAFWILLTVTPVLLGFSMYYTTQLTSTEAFTTLLKEDRESKIFWHGVSFFFTLMAFLVANRFLPNCKVYFKPAFIASAISALLFELAKSLFDSYVTYSLNQQGNYYSIFKLVTIPIFILWLYYCFICFLMGPVIATTIQNYDHHLAHLRRYSWKFSPKPIQSVYILIHIFRHFRIHRNGIGMEQMEEDTGFVFEQLRRCLKNLEMAQLVHVDRYGLYYPSADPNTLMLGEVLHRIIGLRTEGEDTFNPQLSLINDSIHSMLNGKNNIPISTLLGDSPTKMLR